MNNNNKYIIDVDKLLKTAQCKFEFGDAPDDIEYVKAITDSDKCTFCLFDNVTFNMYVRTNGNMTTDDFMLFFHNLITPTAMVYSAAHPYDDNAVQSFRQSLQEMINDDDFWKKIELSVKRNEKH